MRANEFHFLPIGQAPEKLALFEAIALEAVREFSTRSASGRYCSRTWLRSWSAVSGFHYRPRSKFQLRYPVRASCATMSDCRRSSSGWPGSATRGVSK